MTRTLRVGWIGLGDQGAPMAKAVAEAGYELHVWARRATSLEALDGVEFISHDDPGDLGASSDIVGLCLNVDDNNVDVMTKGGLLEAMKPGSVIVNHGTGLPAAARQMLALAAPYGVDVLDAPVSGGRAGAVAKRLVTIVGGDATVLDKCRPVFETFSKMVAHMGATGTGQMAKLLNNTLLMANQENLLQLLAIARKMHVEVAPLVEVLRAGTGSSRALESLGSAITPENADHLREMQLVDMEIFTAAVAELGDFAEPLTTRAVLGARGLPDLAANVH